MGPHATRAFFSRRSFCRIAGTALGSFCFSLHAQEEYKPYTEPPRLLLKPQRLRLLRRERERESPRWLHFNALIAGKAQMPEPGFALALHYLVSLDKTVGRQAVQWAISAAATDVRQIALVYDWCGDLLSATERTQLQARLQRPDTSNAVAAIRNRAFAAIAVADGPSSSTLEYIVKKWWRGEVAPALKAGDRVLSPPETYALFELLHVVRDNLQIELRDDALVFFRDLPASRLLSYYPARYPAAENEYRIPFYSGKGDPDLRAAALSRAADMSLVAYDNNVVESQFIQGWVTSDAFQMRGTFGSPYEFLWANPYQPGLSYYHMPLRFHDTRSGRLFLRSAWEDEAAWASFYDGRLQIFTDGKIQAAAVGTAEKPAIIGTSALIAGTPSMRWKLKPDHPPAWFVVRLKPSQVYEIEVDDEEMAEVTTDRGGILALTFERRDNVGVALRERTAAVATLK
jgi:hypothetical protein